MQDFTHTLDLFIDKKREYKHANYPFSMKLLSLWKVNTKKAKKFRKDQSSNRAVGNLLLFFKKEENL